MSSPSINRLAREMEGACLNMRSRLISRVITRIYDTELRSLGITANQLNLLAAVAAAGPVRRSDIGRYMQIDPSTLTRNLRTMTENGWLEDVAALADGRGAPLRITAEGETLIERASTPWRAAQRRVARMLGEPAVDALDDLSRRLLT